ncbi:hypothetical protein [Kineosporia sp. R_H_3]|uniref:hypothetical protein n=1 Tax=Kineosporia sp. R_H_3 TaxID=1961848 RepID=UPI000B4B92CA|nr:hypothetical protein [Kineosporia sp. R_H_3]
MNATRIPAGGPEDVDLETLLRAELGGVAGAAADQGTPAPTQALLARGRAARRRRTAVVTAGGALATALVLAVGFGVVAPQLRADGGPAVTPSPPPRDVRSWVAALPAGPVPAVERLPASQDGVVRWGGAQTQLPEGVAGRGRFAIPHGATDRGLLLAWFSDQGTGGDDYAMELGWLAGGRWSPVDTLFVLDAAVSPDGTQYAYSGTTATAAAPKPSTVLVVRRVADDSVVTRRTVPDRTVVRGWFDGKVLVTDADGTLPRVLRGDALEPRDDLIPTAPDSGDPVALTSLRGDVVEFTLPSFQGCPEVGGAPTVQTAAKRFEGGAETGNRMLGCVVPDTELVSPDGAWFVGSGDELTVRSMATGEPAGRPGPELPIGAATPIWESDGAHVQVVLHLDGDLRSATIVRCAVADGSCVRAQT